MSAALNLIANRGAEPAQPVKPVVPVEPETPVKTGPGINFLPLDDDITPDIAPEPVAPVKGLFSAVAPDPTVEFPPEDRVEVPVAPDGETGTNRFKRLALASANNDNGERYIETDMETGTTRLALVTEEEFIEFWSVDAYEMVSDLFALMRIDLSEIETDEDELEQGRKAAKHLWKASGRFRWMAWMRMESTVRGGDLFIAAAFFIGKGAMAVRAIKKHKAKKRAVAQAKPKLQKKKPKPTVIEGEVVKDE